MAHSLSKQSEKSKSQVKEKVTPVIWKNKTLGDRSNRRRCFVKKDVLRIFAKFTGKHLCQSLLFNKKPGASCLQLIKKETLAQVFAREFCEISKSTLLHGTPMVAASGIYLI